MLICAAFEHQPHGAVWPRASREIGLASRRGPYVQLQASILEFAEECLGVLPSLSVQGNRIPLPSPLIRRRRGWAVPMAARRTLRVAAATVCGAAGAGGVAVPVAPSLEGPPVAKVGAVRVLCELAGESPAHAPRIEADTISLHSYHECGLDKDLARRRHAGRVRGPGVFIYQRGASTTEVMLADNWKTACMVARYSANAERRTVARYR